MAVAAAAAAGAASARSLPPVLVDHMVVFERRKGVRHGGVEVLVSIAAVNGAPPVDGVGRQEVTWVAGPRTSQGDA